MFHNHFPQNVFSDYDASALLICRNVIYEVSTVDHTADLRNIVCC